MTSLRLDFDHSRLSAKFEKATENSKFLSNEVLLKSAQRAQDSIGRTIERSVTPTGLAGRYNTQRASERVGPGRMETAQMYDQFMKTDMLDLQEERGGKTIQRIGIPRGAYPKYYWFQENGTKSIKRMNAMHRARMIFYRNVMDNYEIALRQGMRDAAANRVSRRLQRFKDSSRG